MNIYTALLSFLNFYCFKPIISKVQTIAKLEPFCIPTCSYIAVVAFLLILISCVKIIEFIVLSAVSYRAADFKPEGRGGGLLFYVCRVSIQDQSFNNFKKDKMKLSVNKPNSSGLLTRNCATIQLFLISEFAFGLEKLPDLSRNGPQVPERSISTNAESKFVVFCILPSYVLLKVIIVLSLLYLGVKVKQYFVCSRCIF